MLIFFFAIGLDFFCAATLRRFFEIALFFLAAFFLAVFFLVKIFGFFVTFAAVLLRVFFAIADPSRSRRIAAKRIGGASPPRQGRRRLRRSNCGRLRLPKWALRGRDRVVCRVGTDATRHAHARSIGNSARGFRCAQPTLQLSRRGADFTAGRHGRDRFEDLRGDLVRVALRIRPAIFEIAFVAVVDEAVRHADRRAAVGETVR